MKTNKSSILIIDDEQDFHENIKYLFDKRFEFESVFSIQAAKDKILQKDYDLIILDLIFSSNGNESEGIEMIPFLTSQTFSPIIVISNTDKTEISAEAIKKGAVDFLSKESLQKDISLSKEKIINAIKLDKIKLFLSHSTKDEKFVNQIGKELRERGFNVWLNNIEAGDVISSTIKVGIKESHYFLVILSPDAINSEWVQGELELALSLEKKGNIRKIIPLLYKDCEIPIRINNRLYVDFRYLHDYDSIEFKSKMKNIADIILNRPISSNTEDNINEEVATKNPEVTALFLITEEINNNDLRSAFKALQFKMQELQYIQGIQFSTIKLLNLADYDSKYINGIITEEKYRIEKNKLLHSLIDFIYQPEINELLT